MTSYHRVHPEVPYADHLCMHNWIAVINKSTLVHDDDVKLMTEAVSEQLRFHAGPDYGQYATVVAFFKNPSAMPADAWHCYVLDDPDQQDALGYHDLADGKPYSRVFAKPVLDNGGAILDGKFTVSQTLSHEVLEIFGDPYCNSWAEVGDGYLYAFELADPVENDGYHIVIRNQKVLVSDYVLPQWFDPQATQGPYSRCQSVSQPFGVAKDGYVVRLKDGTPDQVFGEQYPTWRVALKQGQGSRAHRRMKRRP